MNSDKKPGHPSHVGAPEAAGSLVIDLNEYGAKKDGVRQQMNRRLFMQLLVFRVPSGTPADKTGKELAKVLLERKIAHVVYADTVDPRSLGLLTWSEDPEHFVKVVRPLFAEDPLTHVEFRDDFAMLARSYSIGREAELEWFLLRKPIEAVTNTEFAWHVWYPLRRKGAFARLLPSEQGEMMREHAALGHAYGETGRAQDVRLTCYGLDAGDNEFVIGLIGRDLHTLSHLVQAMRKTRQTSAYIEKMGPFFVGSVMSQSQGA
ncbi:MAG: chlorite dismutase family protein [Polyangiaceae bacterium]|nr:chlorite dismutase family protein [Polyangiaceae bacterium]